MKVLVRKFSLAFLVIYCEILFSLMGLCDWQDVTHCLVNSDPYGFNYRGNKNITRTGKPCLSDNEFSGSADTEPKVYCSRKSGDPRNAGHPWCYIATKREKDAGKPYREECSIPFCSPTSNMKRVEVKPLECLASDDLLGFNYRGTMNATVSGKSCLSWEWAQGPLEMNWKYGRIENYCRNNHTRGGRPWCYIRKPPQANDWEHCPVPYCDSTLECLDPSLDKKGSNYIGTVHQTQSGGWCEPWNGKVAELHYFNFWKYPTLKLDGNFCRNPSPELNSKPWCYTGTRQDKKDGKKYFEYCKIPRCVRGSKNQCYSYTNKGKDYRGTTSRTERFNIWDRSWMFANIKGLQRVPSDLDVDTMFPEVPMYEMRYAQCLRWDDPEVMEKTGVTSLPTLKLSENYCRNFDGSMRAPWCWHKVYRKTDKKLPSICSRYVKSGTTYNCGKEQSNNKGSLQSYHSSSHYYGHQVQQYKTVKKTLCKMPAGCNGNYMITGAGPECIDRRKDPLGSLYRGTIYFTRNGQRCRRWRGMEIVNIFPNAGLDKNYCRNPDRSAKPWCYRDWFKPDEGDWARWDWCDVPDCGLAQDQRCIIKSSDPKGRNYRGFIDETQDGKTCLPWEDDWILKNKPYNATAFPEEGLRGPYCRNPKNRFSKPWCYTLEGIRGECRVPYCVGELEPSQDELRKSHNLGFVDVLTMVRRAETEAVPNSHK